jgi:hypothetical protein
MGASMAMSRDHSRGPRQSSFGRGDMMGLLDEIKRLARRPWGARTGPFPHCRRGDFDQRGERVYSNTRRAPVLSSTVTAMPELSDAAVDRDRLHVGLEQNLR